MTKIEIEAENLKELHDLIASTGYRQFRDASNEEINQEPFVSDYVIIAKGDRLKVQAVSNNIAVLELFYEEVEIEEEGKIVVENSRLFSKAISCFNSRSKLTVEDKENLLRLKNRDTEKEVTISSVMPGEIESYEGSSEFLDVIEYNQVKEVYETEDFSLDITAEASPEKLKTIVEDAIAFESNYICFKQDFDLKAIGEPQDSGYSKVEMNLEAEISEGQGSTQIEYGLHNIVNGPAVSGPISLYSPTESTVNLHFGEDRALIIEKETDRYEIKYIVAPIVEEEKGGDQ